MPIEEKYFKMLDDIVNKKKEDTDVEAFKTSTFQDSNMAEIESIALKIKDPKKQKEILACLVDLENGAEVSAMTNLESYAGVLSKECRTRGPYRRVTPEDAATFVKAVSNLEKKYI